MNSKEENGKKAWIKDLVRNEGLRMTVPRQVIVEALEKAKSHLSADEVYMMVHDKNSGIGLTTVYRTLELLSGMGVLNKFEFGDGCARYEFKADEEKHHHHLICSQCGKVIDYDEFAKEETELMEKIEKYLREKYCFEIERHLLHFYGKCRQCRKKIKI